MGLRIERNLAQIAYTNKSSKISRAKENIFSNGISKSPSRTEKAAGVGLIALGLLGVVFGGRVKTTKATIEKTQKIFKNVFMREDITAEETIQMIKRYKEIEKIPDKKEYIMALFKEAKKNYGFNKGSLHCKIVNNPKSSVGGENNPTKDYIEINIAHKRDKMIEYVHHELRHAKQDFCAFNYNAEDAIRSTMENDFNAVLNGTSEMSAMMQPIYSKYKNFDEFYEAMQPVKENILNTIKKKYGIEKFSKDVIPESQYEYAQKCIEAMKTKVNHSVDLKGYYNNFLEGGDAYPAGISISEALRKAFTEIP